MNNSVFGKTMENLRNGFSIELVKDAEKAEKLVKKPNFVDVKIFDEFFDCNQDEKDAGGHE